MWAGASNCKCFKSYLKIVLIKTNCFKKLGQGRKEKRRVFTRQSWREEKDFLFFFLNF